MTKDTFLTISLDNSFISFSHAIETIETLLTLNGENPQNYDVDCIVEQSCETDGTEYFFTVTDDELLESINDCRRENPDT